VLEVRRVLLQSWKQVLAWQVMVVQLQQVVLQPVAQVLPVELVLPVCAQGQLGQLSVAQQALGLQGPPVELEQLVPQPLAAQQELLALQLQLQGRALVLPLLEQPASSSNNPVSMGTFHQFLAGPDLTRPTSFAAQANQLNNIPVRFVFDNPPESPLPVAPLPRLP
jgi:hypothetical protein